MKRILSLILICLILSASFAVLSTTAADSGFDIRDGVLVSYSGNSAEVTIPSSVKAVGARAFEGNKDITSLTVPSSVDSIGDKAFYGCSKLKTVKGGANITDAGVFAFNGTPYFEESTDEFLMLGKTLLWYNGDSLYVTLPSSCLSIAPYAFYRYSDLKMIRCSSELVSVGAGAFYDCGGLVSVDLPSSVSYIGAYAFDGTPFISSMGEFAVIGDGILVRYMGAETRVQVPEGVRRIAPFAFRSSKLASVSIPSSVYSIDPYAFADCVGLKAVDFSDGQVIIGDCAFRGCKKLSSLTTPSSLSYIGQHAFSGAGLSDVRLLGTDLTVSDNAFKDCKSMRYALLSNGVTALYDGAFAGCSSIEGISIPSTASQVSTDALDGCDKVVVTCPVGSAAFSSLLSNEMNHIIGDADSDGELSVLDATAIQCYAAGIIAYNGAQAAASDFDFNGAIDIIDAADVQLSIAEIN
ncbi:MAG: leucine-rich repeat protein [Ruminococcus sp.]|nr:leucine-rich repeat protein [Ruminococcus sp.]